MHPAGYDRLYDLDHTHPFEEDLFSSFFLVYSPIKIRHQGLLDKRNRQVFFREFEISRLASITDTTIDVQLKWIENIPDAKPCDIQLTRRRGKELNAINAKW